MKLEETIQEMFDNYPILFHNRIDCLNHLFCVIGNGYDWMDGELVDEDAKDIKNNLIDGKAFQHNKDDYFNMFRTKNNKVFIYPLCKEYSYLFNFPQDIKNDWIMGASEMFNFICEEVEIDSSAFQSISFNEFLLLKKDFETSFMKE